MCECQTAYYMHKIQKWNLSNSSPQPQSMTTFAQYAEWVMRGRGDGRLAGWKRLEDELVAYFRGKSPWKKKIVENLHRRVCQGQRAKLVNEECAR